MQCCGHTARYSGSREFTRPQTKHNETIANGCAELSINVSESKHDAKKALNPNCRLSLRPVSTHTLTTLFFCVCSSSRCVALCPTALFSAAAAQICCYSHCKITCLANTVVFGSGAIYGRIRIPGPGCCYSIAFRCAPIPPVAGVVDAFSVRIACAEIKRDITADLRCVHWHRRAACWATIYAVARAPARKRF